MPNPIIKIYAISISASSPFIGADGEASGHIFYHKPGLIPAESMDHAADAAQQEAFKTWPASEGWSGHQAVIQPVTKRFCELFERASISGVIGEDSEEIQIFKWE